MYDVIDDYEVVAEVKINKMEAPNSDDGDGFNLNKCAAYVPHHMEGIEGIRLSANLQVL